MDRLYGWLIMQSCSNGVQDETLIWDLCYDPRQCSNVWSVQKKPALSCEVEHWATVVSWSTHCCRTLRSCCVTRVHMRTEQGSLVGGVRVEVQSSQMCVMGANAAGFLWFLKKKAYKEEGSQSDEYHIWLSIKCSLVGKKNECECAAVPQQSPLLSLQHSCYGL